MDIQLKEKPWYVKYRLHIVSLGLLLLLLVAAIVTILSPSRRRVSATKVHVATVVAGDFMEYLNADGLLQPINTHRVNAREGGVVLRCVAENGSMVQKGDTLLVLANPALERDIDEMRHAYEKEYNSYRERVIEMEQKSLALQQQTLQTSYELARLEKQYALDCEEFRMGIRSKAELQVSKDEYEYRKRAAELQMKSMLQDSSMNVIRREMLDADLLAERKKMQRASERLNDLVVLAVADGQLSGLTVATGQSVSAGDALCEIKVLDSYKMQVAISEYYIDRITAGQLAEVGYNGGSYNLIVNKVVPEVSNGTFLTDMIFTDSLPDNARVGKSYQVRVELGAPSEALLMPKGDFFVKTAGRWVYKFVGESNRAVKVPVTIGHQNPAYYEIVNGLSAGDRVIVAGYDILGDAEEVIIE